MGNIVKNTLISSLESSNPINEFSRCLVSRHFFLYGLHGPQMITLPAKDEKSDPSVWQFYSTVTSPPTTKHPDSVWHDFFLPLWRVDSLTVSVFVALIKVFICMLSLFLWRVKSFPSFPNLLLSGTLSVSSMPGEMLPKFFWHIISLFSGKSKKLPKFPLWHPFCFSDCQLARWDASHQSCQELAFTLILDPSQSLSLSDTVELKKYKPFHFSCLVMRLRICLRSPQAFSSLCFPQICQNSMF